VKLSNSIQISVFRRSLVSELHLPTLPVTCFDNYPKMRAGSCFMSYFIHPRWHSMFAGRASAPATTPQNCSATTEGEPDPELRRFSIDHDKAYVLPSLRDARKVNPDLFLFSSPWSPPGWMKANKSMLGGCIQKRYFPSYAQHFVKFLQAYAAEGVPIQAVTSQNEVDTDQDGRMPACLWGQEYEIEFISKHLGPALEGTGLSTKIWLLDHNYNLWGRVICSLDDARVRQHCGSVAWHGYVGRADRISKVHAAHPDVSMHWTEGGPDYTRPNYATDWAVWARTFSEALGNWCSSIIGWNLALDERGRPIACVNPDGKRVLVLANPGPARTIELRAGMMAVAVTLESDSVNTLTWQT